MKCAISSGSLALAAGDCAVSAKKRPGEQEVKQEVITCLWLNNLLAGVSKGIHPKVMRDGLDTLRNNEQS